MVVGGGASAFDLIEQGLLHGRAASSGCIAGCAGFSSLRPKAMASVRPSPGYQAGGLGAAQQSAHWARTWWRAMRFVQAIQPRRPMDVLHDQLFPGAS